MSGDVPAPSGGAEPKTDGESSWRGPEGFEEFFHQYQPMVRRYLVWREAEASVLDDAVQMTMMSAYRHWDRIRRFDPPTGWLFKIAGQRLQDARQVWFRERTQSLEAFEGARPRLVQADPAPATDRRLDILDAVRKLPARQQEALALRVQFGFPYKDIATIMGIAPGTARAHIHQAHQTLRVLLGAEGDDA